MIPRIIPGAVTELEASDLLMQKRSEMAWLLVYSAALALAIWQGPQWLGVSDFGQVRVRGTIRAALVLYAIALNLLWVASPADRAGTTRRGSAARLLWSCACLTFLVHVALAFHYAHGWSHARAMAHTEEVSGFGPGIFFSHLFSLLWAADVLCWWLWPKWYSSRSRTIDLWLHGYMLFIVFNGTVVFETGTARLLGVCLFAELLVFILATCANKRSPSQS